jgi:hypothetical protein
MFYPHPFYCLVVDLSVPLAGFLFPKYIGEKNPDPGISVVYKLYSNIGLEQTAFPRPHNL